VGGYRFFFYSLENREPPHIHVAQAGRYAKHWLEPVALASNSIVSSSWRNGMPVSVETSEALAVNVSCSDDALTVVLDDGRSVSVPLEWFPRLAAATPRERKQWEPIGGGIGVHWNAIDEDVSVASLLQPERFMRMAAGALKSTRGQTSRELTPRKSTRTRRAAKRVTNG
jgi:hypothetical protein